MSPPLQVKQSFHVRKVSRGRKIVRAGRSAGDGPRGRVPRVARLMALAIRFDGLIRSGQVADQAELARLGYVTRARLTQIMNLLNLTPDIQEEILHLRVVEQGRDQLTERQLRPIAAQAEWGRQSTMWQAVRRCN